MRNARSLLTVLGLIALLVSVGQATAQTLMKARATIPFEFWIEGDHLPAGDYQIVQIESISYLLFLSIDGNNVAGAYTVPLDDTRVKNSDARLIFRIEDGRRYFYGGWGPYGKHVLRAQSEQAVPSGNKRVEVPVTFR